MIDISTALSNILKAVYGKQVRESIHDAIYQINQNANEAVDLAQIRFGADVTSPTSSVEGYTEGVIYFNVLTGIIWKLSGGSWDPLGSMKSIKEIRKTATQGNVDTYTIYYNDETTGGFVVRNGEQGVSVVNITKTDSAAGVDYYEVNLSDGSTTPNGFAVTNGKDGVSVSNITLESTVGDTKNYSVNLSDGTKTPNGFSVKDGTSNYVYIRYSASFDGQGMVTVPTDNTVYIGICVSTQSTAPTDPAVYSWVRFIGKSGTGSGDMLSSDFVTIYKNTFVVDNAAALFDGQKQILANELLNKTDYASNGLAGTVDKATQLVDKENSKVADTKVLANFTDDGTGLKYKGEKVGGEVAVDEETITTNEDGELTLNSEVSAKIPNQVPTVSDKGKAPIVQEDGTVAWGTVASDISKLKGRRFVILTDSYGVIDDNFVEKLKTLLPLTENDNLFKFAYGGAGFVSTDSSHKWYNLFSNDYNTVTNPSTITDFIILGGCNDLSQTQNDIETNANQLFDFIKLHFTNANIHVGMFGFGKSTNVNKYTEIKTIYLGLAKYGVTVIPNANTWLHYTGYITDNVHPNSDGSMKLAQGLANYIICGNDLINYDEKTAVLTPIGLSTQFSVYGTPSITTYIRGNRIGLKSSAIVLTSVGSGLSFPTDSNWYDLFELTNVYTQGGNSRNFVLTPIQLAKGSSSASVFYAQLRVYQGKLQISVFPPSYTGGTPITKIDNTTWNTISAFTIEYDASDM